MTLFVAPQIHQDWRWNEKASWFTPVPPSALCVQKLTVTIDMTFRSQHSHVHQLSLHMGANGRLTVSFDFTLSTHRCNTFCSCIFTCCQFAKKTAHEQLLNTRRSRFKHVSEITSLLPMAGNPSPLRTVRIVVKFGGGSLKFGGGYHIHCQITFGGEFWRWITEIWRWIQNPLPNPLPK